MNTSPDTATPPRLDWNAWSSELELEPRPVVAVRAPQSDLESPGEQHIRRCVWGVLASLYPAPRHIDRRQEQRYPFPYLVRLYAADETGTDPCGTPVVVVGKQLSERGLGFYHPRPLANRRVIAVLDAGQGTPLAFLLDLSWCRFTSQGWYESGGRFLQVVAVPADGRTDR